MTTFIFNRRVTTLSVNELIKAIAETFNAGEQEITLLINSIGGEIFPAFIFQKFVKEKLNHRDIRCINIGKAHSSACILFLSFDTDNRYYVSDSDFMVHSAKNSISSTTLANNNVIYKINELNQDQIKIIEHSTNLSNYYAVPTVINSGNDFYIRGSDIELWGFAKEIDSCSVPLGGITI